MQKIKPAVEKDEYTHTPTDESNYNESMYFNFFDHTKVVGGFVRIGNRPNEGYAEVTFLYYMPGQNLLFFFQRPEISDNEAFLAANMEFKVVNPFKELGIFYQGQAFHLTDPYSLEDPKKAFSQARTRAVNLELTVRGLSPIYGGISDSDAVGSEEIQFAQAHYEQQIYSTGFLEIDGERTQIEAMGLRDHSWGPRYWQAPKYYRWLTVQFRPDLALMLSYFVSPSEKVTAGGFLYRDGENTLINEVDIQTVYEDKGPYQKDIRARFVTEKGEELSLEGDVIQMAPLRNRRKGQNTRICEGFTRYRLGDNIGYGISEYLDQG